MSAPGVYAMNFSADVTAIQRVASALRIGEFDLFRRAHRAWFGRDADENEIESVFAAYVSECGVPFWVRHFCRETSRRLDAARPRGFADPFEQRIAAFAVVVALAGVLVLLNFGHGAPDCAGGDAAPGALTHAIADDARIPPC